MTEQDDLANEALDLCRRLAQAQLDEEARRDFYGTPIGDASRTQHFEGLRAKAADRWRRRMGYDNLQGGAQ